MRYVDLDKIKPGMRLARPIYNKAGVLLFERGSAIKDISVIQSIKGFGLIGLFILEPTEPVPPMTEEDIEFERFQTMMSFQIQEELNYIIDKKRDQRLTNIAETIIRSYGRRKKKVTFIQGLRSKEDYYYKHALNVAILSAMIAHAMNVTPQDQMEAVKAALIHDIGKVHMPPELYSKAELTKEDKEAITQYEVQGHMLIGDAFMTEPNLKRIVTQTQRILKTGDFGADLKKIKVFPATRVLTVAERFDLQTAIQPGRDPFSEISVLQEMRRSPDVYDPKAVNALINSITLLMPGSSVVLSNGTKALVLQTGDDVLRPMVLTFDTNRMIDLSSQSATEDPIYVVDLVKTLDNRVVMDSSTLKQFGFTAKSADAEVVQDEKFVDPTPVNETPAS